MFGDDRQRPESRDDERLDAWLVLTDQLSPGTDTVRLPLLSGSMAPALPSGSTLVIDPHRRRRFGRGDVVVFADGDRLVAHRVLLRLRLPGLDAVLEKGDANPVGRWMASRRIRGVVCEVTLPDGGRVMPRDRAAAGRGLRLHLRRIRRWREAQRHEGEQP